MTNIPISELHLIQSLYKASFTQKDIKLKVDLVRHKEGRFKGKGISTNTISELSPRSKHVVKRTTAIHEYHTRKGVIQKIMDCMKCKEKEAKSIYKTRIKPLCPTRFTDESGAGLMSIRYYSLACNSELYYMWTSVDYADVFNIEPDETNDIWTYRSGREYKEVCDGSLTLDDIMFELRSEANGEYDPILLNVCILHA